MQAMKGMLSGVMQKAKAASAARDAEYSTEWSKGEAQPAPPKSGWAGKAQGAVKALTDKVRARDAEYSAEWDRPERAAPASGGSAARMAAITGDAPTPPVSIANPTPTPAAASPAPKQAAGTDFSAAWDSFN